jgi:hypothetical protein
MITNSTGSAFWGRPTPWITPGDVFPDIPFAAAPFPLQLVKRSPINPKHGYRPNYNLYEYPTESDKADTDPKAPGVHDLLSQGRVSKAVFLSWGSEVEDDLRNYEQSARAGGRTWIAAPIFEVADLSSDPAGPKDPVSGALASPREIVMANRTHHCFYLKPLPDATPEHLGWYADFRKLSAVRINHFIAQKDQRIATLMGDTRNELFHQLLLFFTRARIFFGPIACEHCGQVVRTDATIEDQNQAAEPWL